MMDENVPDQIRFSQSEPITPEIWLDPNYVGVIAEIGINHNGSLETAKHLIDVAHDAGCDAVKFQKRTVEER